MFGRQDAGEVACTDRESRRLSACISVLLLRQRERLRAAQRIDFTGFASGNYNLGPSVQSAVSLWRYRRVVSEFPVVKVNPSILEVFTG